MKACEERIYCSDSGHMSAAGVNKIFETFFAQIDSDKRKGWKALLSHRYLLLGLWVGSP